MTPTAELPPGPKPARSATYEAAGVSIKAGERAVQLMRASVQRASRPEVVGGIGGFAGLFDLTPYTRFRKPLLATSTDGVGTKVDIARRLDIHDTIGIDLVAMVLDDLVVCGAEPLFMTDYIATGKVVPERIAAIVSGIAEGCSRAGAALIGGETAEHPGLMRSDEYDIAGAGTGIVDADDVLGAERVGPGDVLIAMASSGLHANGFSLARHVFFNVAGWSVETQVAELDRTLGEELLEPTRIYSLDCLALAADPLCDVHAFSHITGGGLADNVARVLPESVTATVDRGTWNPPVVFDLLSKLGSVERHEIERTCNQGIGMIAIVAADSADTVLARLSERQLPAWVCGEVAAGNSGPARVELTGEHRR